MSPALTIQLPLQVLKAGSHDPILGTNFYSDSKKLLMRINISMSLPVKKRIRRLDRVNQP